jgi:spore maturation protein CgeB
MKRGLRIGFFGSSLVSAHRNGVASYYRGIIRALHDRGHLVTFFEPDAFDWQAHRDIPDPPWANVVVYAGTGEEGVHGALEDARGCDVVVKASRVGIFDDLLEAAVLELRSPWNRIVYWDVDALATLDRLERNGPDPFRSLIPEYDLVLIGEGGEQATSAYERLGARACVPIYGACDPSEHHPAASEPRFAADLSLLVNRTPDEEARMEEYFLRAASLLPERRFLLGGDGWEDKRVPPNVVRLGHVHPHEHNAFNASAAAVLGVRRGSTRYGFSPAARVFEAAGVSVCLIIDDGEEIERFFEPGREVLVARDGADVADHVSSLGAEQARALGTAARRRVLAEHTYAHRAQIVDALLRAELPAVSKASS